MRFHSQRAVLGRAVSSRVLDEVYKVYPEVTSEQMEEVENFLEENQAVKELAGAYLDVMAGSVKDGTRFLRKTTKR